MSRDNGYGQVWEWYDTPAESRELEIVRAVISARRAVVRSVGRQYYDDHTVSGEEKAALQRVLDAYDALLRS